MSNPFDFNNLDDLPENLRSKLETDTLENARQYAAVVNAGAEAGFSELSINQIIAAAHRLGYDVPTQATVRAYLNKAVEAGLIGKPSRVSYGALAVASIEEQVEEVAPKKAEKKAAKASDDDPLANIGL